MRISEFFSVFFRRKNGDSSFLEESPEININAEIKIFLIFCVGGIALIFTSSFILASVYGHWVNGIRVANLPEGCIHTVSSSRRGTPIYDVCVDWYRYFELSLLAKILAPWPIIGMIGFFTGVIRIVMTVFNARGYTLPNDNVDDDSDCLSDTEELDKP